MRILILGRADYVLLRRRLRELVALGHDVHLVSLQRGEIPGVTVWPLEPLGGPLKYLACLPAVRSTLSRVQPDVVDAHGATTYGLYGLARLDAFPLVTTVYGSDITVGARQHRLLAWATRRSLSRADLVYGSSTVAGTDIDDVLKLDLGERLVTHTWGVPVGEILRNREERRRTIRRELATLAETRVVLHNRCMVSHWRILTILDSIPSVISRVPDACFWFAYPPPNRESSEYLARVERRIEKLGIGRHVKLLGPQPYERMLSVVHAADAYLCVGESDLLASSVLEALCAGKLPILNALPAYEELLRGDRDLLLAEVTPDNIADRVVAAFEDSAGLAARVSPVAKRIRVEHDSEAATRWLGDLYRRAAAAHERRRGSSG